MNFNEQNQPVKTLVLHYAKQLNCDLAKAVVSGNSKLQSKQDAQDLAYFFWKMTDQGVEDQNSHQNIEGISDLQFWLEKALYIFTGYFKQQGYEQAWSEGYDKYHDE